MIISFPSLILKREKIMIVNSTAPATSTNFHRKDDKKRYQPIQGYADYNEAQNQLFSEWKQKLTNVYAEHGFTAFNSRPVEKWDNLRKDGTLQQVFRICRDNGDITDLALPFDRTVSLALYIANYAGQICFPFKRSDIGVSHRGEQPSPGRFRGFIQADVDIVSRGLTTLDDVECLVTLLDGLKVLGINNYTMFVNQIELPKAMVSSLGLSEEKISQALRIIDKLDKHSEEEVLDLLLKLAPELDPIKSMDLIKVFKYKGSLEDFVVLPEWGEKAVIAVRELKDIYEYLQIYEINPLLVQFSPGMVRGLAYYTGLVFETFLNDFPQLGSIASGGRYVNLVGDFNPNLSDIGGVGGSIGLTRLFDIMLRNELIAPKKASVADISVGFQGIEQRAEAINIATQLRKNGFAVDIFSSPNAKKFLGYADKKKIPYAVLVRHDGVALKMMLNKHSQIEIDPKESTIERILSYVKK